MGRKETFFMSPVFPGRKDFPRIPQSMTLTPYLSEVGQRLPITGKGVRSHDWLRTVSGMSSRETERFPQRKGCGEVITHVSHKQSPERRPGT